MEKFHSAPVRDYAAVSRYAGQEDFEVEQPDSTGLHKEFEIITQRLTDPTETEITETLRQMGKIKPTDELNCGSCGYDTCRDIDVLAVPKG